MATTLADRLAAAKLWLISPATNRGRVDAPRDLAYLAHALYALITVPTEQVATIRADEYWRLYVNPRWAVATSVPELGRELAHAVWHLLMEHAARARGVGVDSTTSEDWHQACDLTVHDTLAPEKCSPDPVASGAEAARAARPGSLDPGKSAEEYFAVLSRLPAPQADRQRHPTQAASSQEQLPQDASGDGVLGNQLGDCGSACDGIPRDTDLPPESEVGQVSRTLAEGIRKQVAIDYLATQKTRGTRSGEAMRWARHITQPEIAWEPLLARAVRRAIGWTSGRHNPTWTRPSRRQSSHPDVLQPGWRRPLPNIAMIIDTSGSIDDRLLGKAMGEVEGALAGMGIRGGSVTVLACDASVGAVTRVRKAADATLVGGGGTDMRVGIAAASAQRPRPDLIVVFTDGYTPWPEQAPPGSAVIAAMLGREGEYLPDTPSWATRIACVLRS